MLKKYIVETVIEFFGILWWIESLKEQNLFEVEIFCNIIHLFTINLMHPCWRIYKISYSYSTEWNKTNISHKAVTKEM